MNEQNLKDKIEIWHDADEHQLITKAIEALTESEQTTELLGLLARAYNNRGHYTKAIELLELIKQQSENDPEWHFRYGYALYFIDKDSEALTFFQHAKNLAIKRPDIDDYINRCLEEIEANSEHEGEILYNEEESNAVEAHIMQYFGEYDRVFHELDSPDIHVDIAVINPTKERNYYTLVTMGMGAYKMDVPEELADKRLERAEILVTLPPNWKLEDEDDKWFWPINWLKILARLPIDEETWLGWGHSIPNGRPFANNTKLNTLLLLEPTFFEDGCEVCVLPDGDEVNFYQMIPLYQDECEYKNSHGVEALEEFLPDDFDMVVDIKRRNFLK